MKNVMKFLVLFMLLINLMMAIGFSVDFIQTASTLSLGRMVVNVLFTMLMMSSYKTLNEDR